MPSSALTVTLEGCNDNETAREESKLYKTPEKTREQNSVTNMPRDGHSAAGRARSLSESRVDSAARNSGSEPQPADSDSGAEARGSDSESDTGRPQGPGRVHQACPGCNKSFASISSLRRHRNSFWMTDPACRNAGLKRPRTVRVGDSARDARDLIQQMVGDAADSGLPPGAAPDPFVQPRDEVNDVKSELRL